MRREVSRRTLISAAGALALGAFAPTGLRLSSQTKRDLWRNHTGTHLRGAVFVQRRVYPDLDGSNFLGGGAFGPPVTDEALDLLAECGANLASWSGPGLFAETNSFRLDPAVEDHIADWLDRCRMRGLYTTLCVRSGPGRSAFAFHPGEDWYPASLYDDSLWRSGEKQAAWVEMVGETLMRFGAHPALAGIVPMDEPNGSDLGQPHIWPEMARQIVEHVGQGTSYGDTPLLFSPDRWARVEACPALRTAIGKDHPVVLHHYEPWEFTHQSEDQPLAYNRIGMRTDGLDQLKGDWSVLEFGAVRRAPGVERYLQDRIEEWETAGANWAAFRWTSGWDVYERAEGSMNIRDDDRLWPVLERAFARNRLRPA